jgi:uncharacterized protein (DUF885 family)
LTARREFATLPRAMPIRALPTSARSLLGAAALALLGAACGSAEPRPPYAAPPIPAYAGSPLPKQAAGSGSGAASDAPTSGFAALRDRILDQWLRDDPAMARGLGLHESDGKIAEYGAEAIKARIARLTQQQKDLNAVDKASLSADDALDLALISSQAGLYLFQLEELASFQHRPQFYEELFSVNVYLDHDYAPLEERLQKLLEHEKAALAQIASVRKNLVSPMSKPVVETALKIYKGYAEYLRGDVVKQSKGVGAPAFQADLTKTNAALADEADKLAAFLKDEARKGDSSHVLGVPRYKKLLSLQEGLTIPLADFKKMGEENLQTNKTAFEAAAKKAKLTRPKSEALLDEATKLMNSSRQFVIDKKIATIPSEDKAVLKETPPFQRWNAAFLDGPGPFEKKVTQAYYYITRPDPSWPKKEQEEYLMGLGILMATTVHEVYPGHFLQGQWIHKAPTRAQKMLASYSFVEGWAHYGEQVMVEEGFGAEDPQNKLGQLADALLRNCRFVVSLGVHTEGMTLAQAEKRFITDCHQDKATAREQAVRATFDPGYFAYTLGKVQILALRDEAKKRLGAKFSLQKFHDALLSHGSPPVPLIHDRVLKDLEAGL